LSDVSGWQTSGINTPLNGNPYENKRGIKRRNGLR
jgi:hypothetical protein